MRKLFLLIPAMLLSLAMNAATHEIGSGTSNILGTTVAAAAENDVIILTDDTDPYVNKYATENGDDYTRLEKSLTIQAGEGVHPVVKYEVPFRSRNGKSVKFIGITFDGSSLSHYDFYFRCHTNDNNNLEFENCEFKNCSKYIFQIYEGMKAGTLTFKNCRFHDNTNRGILNQGRIDNLIIDGCEFSNFTGNPVIDNYTSATIGKIKINDTEFFGNTQYMINGTATSHADSCIITNCHVHNNSKSFVYFRASTVENVETCDGIVIANSTFENNDFSSISYNLIDISYAGTPATNDTQVLVDHCTFYNCPVTNSDYAAVKIVATHPLVSNCIFALEQLDVKNCRAVHMQDGREVRNCLTYNYTKDSNWGIRSGVTKTNCIKEKSPLFADEENGDFTLKRNYITNEVSPAYKAGTEASTIGDPRWETEAIYPETDFAGGYAFTAQKAKLEGKIVYETEAPAQDPYIRYNHSTPTGTAEWVIKATRPCYVQATINTVDNTWNYLEDDDIRKWFVNHKHIYVVEILDANSNSIGSVKECDYEEDGSSDGVETNPNTKPDILLPGFIYIPEAGVYTVKLKNPRNGARCGVGGITLTYLGGETQAMPGTANINDAWFSPEGTRTDGKISFPGSTIQNGWVKWNVSFATASNYKAIVKASTTSGHNYTVKLYRDENDQNPITFANGANYDQTGDPVNIEIDPQLVEAGDYILEVVNSLTNSNAKLLGVQFVYAGGGIVDLPATLTPQDAVLEQGAYIDNDSINFARLEDAYAKWNVHSDGGYYTFKTNAFNAYALGQKYTISIYNSDETELIYSKQSVWNNTVGAFSFTTDAINLPENDYVVRIKNYDGSKGRVMNIEPEYAGGAIVTIPNNNIPLADALLSTRAYRDNDGLHFTDADHYYCIADENATWNIQATAGVYTFTLNVAGTNYGIYELTVTDSQNNQVFKDSKGKSGTGTVSISSVLIPADGNYTIQLANINNHADGYLTSLAAAKEDVIVLDELAENNTVLVENQNTPKRIMLKRTFKGGMFNTICLPFSIGSNSTLEDIFGEGYELLQLVDATLEGSVLNLQFENVNTLSHGIPYLIKPAADVTNPVISNRTIKDLTVPEYTRGVVDFVGNFIKDEIPASENNLFLATNNALYFPTEALPIKGMRAYFKVNIPGAAHVLSHARIVTREQIVTDVELVNGQSNNTEKRIENGQLIIIKNGVRYNVMGTKIQ